MNSDGFFALEQQPKKVAVIGRYLFTSFHSI